MNKNNFNQFTVGEVLVIPARNEVEAHGKKIRLQPKVMEVLHYLARHHDRVVPNEELTEQVWQGRIVTHGSVQKSINLLRKAFAELVDQEIVAHYSKRGYQLQIQPVFLETQHGDAPVPSPNWLSVVSSPRSRVLGGVCIALLLLFLSAAYLALNWYTLFITKSHRTQFASITGYTSEVGHERGAEPHPDNQHVAYIKDLSGSGGAMATASHLVVRNGKGRDWQFATSNGIWFELSWSPTGQSLVAIEKIREDGDPLSPDFFATAAQLYSIHVFSLDVDNRRILETNRLSQWQGQINSATWWDEDTIELVAKQGQALNQRYRYSLKTQRLDIVEALDFVSNPLLTRVHKQRTALASLHNGNIRIDFLGPDQSRFASRQLDFHEVDISWLPDGSGVLVHATDEKALGAVYRNGEWLEIPVPQSSDAAVSRPRYSADGNRIYFAEQRPQADLWLDSINEEDRQITENSYLNYGASFSPQGDRIAYVSIRNNQPQIWLIEDGVERQISRHSVDGSLSNIIWTKDGENLVYKAGGTLYMHHLLQDRTNVLLTQAHDITPLSLDPDTHQLMALRQTGGARNLWRINYENGNEKQLTFGSVGPVVEHSNDVYFQYTGQGRLWIWHDGSEVLEPAARHLSRHLERNSKILTVDDSGIYYITGGNCRESDIYYLAFEGDQKHVYLSRDKHQISTASFHPDRGAVYTHCRLPESDIMVLE